MKNECWIPPGQALWGKTRIPLTSAWYPRMGGDTAAAKTGCEAGVMGSSGEERLASRVGALRADGAEGGRRG